MRILIIEDELDFAKPLAKGLREEGYIVDIAEDGANALYLFELYPFDMVLLDLNLPDQDGLTLCKTFRELKKEVLICIISARINVLERVEGLDHGADDYLTKPIHFQELLAHIRALSRRNLNLRTPLVEIGELTLDTNAQTASAFNAPIELTAKEYRLLEYLVKNRDQILSHEALILNLWGEEDALFSNAIRTHVCAIRRKLKQAGVSNPCIVTKINQGYVLETASNT